MPNPVRPPKPGKQNHFFFIEKEIKTFPGGSPLEVHKKRRSHLFFFFHFFFLKDNIFGRNICRTSRRRRFVPPPGADDDADAYDDDDDDDDDAGRRGGLRRRTSHSAGVRKTRPRLRLRSLFLIGHGFFLFSTSSRLPHLPQSSLFSSRSTEFYCLFLFLFFFCGPFRPFFFKQRCSFSKRMGTHFPFDLMAVYRIDFLFRACYETDSEFY